MKLFYYLLGAVMLMLTASCNDETSSAGSSLVTDEVEIIVDSTFTVSGRTVSNGSVQSRTITQLLGRLNAREYGSFSSDIVTQYLPSFGVDTTGITVNEIDSVQMVLLMEADGFTGDSIVPMGVSVYKLDRQLPSPIFSNFDPSDYYSESGLMGSAIYTAANNSFYNTAGVALRSIYIDLPLSFGREVYQKYLSSPNTFATPEAFADFFPGCYITTSFGAGRVINIGQSMINFFYHRTELKDKDDPAKGDTVMHYSRIFMAVTPEIVTNNNITLDMSADLNRRIQQGQHVIVAPTGTDVTVRFPAREIISTFRAQGGSQAVLNTLTFNVPAEVIENSYNINPPQNVLLVLSSKKDEFFANNDLPDGKTSFVASYDSATGSYNFSSMRDYILDLINKSSVTDEDIEFTLTPVDIETETTSNGYQTTTVMTAVCPYVSSPSMVRLMLDDVKITLTFSKRSINN